MKMRATLWRMKMNLAEDFVSTEQPFSKHARMARGAYQHEGIFRFVQQAPDDRHQLDY